MKTHSIILSNIKSTDGWNELAYNLLFDKFKQDNINLEEDELHDKFFSEVISKKFKYGEYAKLEVIFNEDLKIVGGGVIL